MLIGSAIGKHQLQLGERITWITEGSFISFQIGHINQASLFFFENIHDTTSKMCSPALKYFYPTISDIPYSNFDLVLYIGFW